MTTERNSIEQVESSSVSATSDFAAQAWDSSNWRGNNPRADESKLTFIDLGNNDIYNSRRGNRELNDGNSGLQSAENRISRVVDKLLDGDYDTSKLVKELQRSDKTLDGATGDYGDAVKHLGASATTENLDDLVDGRRNVMDADKKVEKAIKQLKDGDENGAIKSLLQSLGEIDSAQKDFKDARTDDDERSARRGNPRDRGHGHGDDDCKDGDGGKNGGKENTDDFRPGNRTSRRDNDERVHDHMYRGGRQGDDRDHLVWAGGTPDFDETGGRGIQNDDGYGIPFDDEYAWGTGAGYRARNSYNNDYGRTDSGMWGSGDRDSSSFAIPNPFGGTDRIQFGDSGPSRITIGGPFGGRTTVDLDQLAEAGDKVAKVIDPIGFFPTPSEAKDPGKLVKAILDPFDFF